MISFKIYQVYYLVYFVVFLDESFVLEFFQFEFLNWMVMQIRANESHVRSVLLQCLLTILIKLRQENKHNNFKVLKWISLVFFFSEY